MFTTQQRNVKSLHDAAQLINKHGGHVKSRRSGSQGNHNKYVRYACQCEAVFSMCMTCMYHPAALAVPPFYFVIIRAST